MFSITDLIQTRLVIKKNTHKFEPKNRKKNANKKKRAFYLLHVCASYLHAD